MSDIFAARSQMAISLLIGGSATVCGDALAGVTARRRPTKLAAMAGDFQTRNGAPLRIGGLPDTQTKKYKIARMAAMLQVGMILWGWGLAVSFLAARRHHRLQSGGSTTGSMVTDWCNSRRTSRLVSLDLLSDANLQGQP
jgi:cytochrome bd-type quinol oxidase subunit 1